MDTVWVLGDQLSHVNSALAGRAPGTVRVLIIESRRQILSAPRHRQRTHLVLAAMRKYGQALERRGYEVDYRRADTFDDGIQDHRRSHGPDTVYVMEPTSWRLSRRLEQLGVRPVKSNAFLCHYTEFADWAEGRNRLVMEDFYRWQRTRLGYLMDGDEPAGGTWNYDRSNREPLPEGFEWPVRPVSRIDDVDDEVMEGIPGSDFGAQPDGTWATTRRGALRRLRHFIEEVLPAFGPYQDAMTSESWSVTHSLLSPYLNLGLLHPSEVCDAAEDAYRNGRVPIESAEGFIRQIIGWREYVWGIYWLFMPAYEKSNFLGAQRSLPPLFTEGGTRMNCVRNTLQDIHDHAYAHHIQRLMILSNFALLAGVSPAEFVSWMTTSFIDGAQWVMLPNVLGMGLYADGGLMATKPYAAGGNYINRMSDYCGECFYDPGKRTGEQACPFTNLYWQFLLTNQELLGGNHRISRQLGGARQLRDGAEVLEEAGRILDDLDGGRL